jgi:hypothetical protein
MEHFHDHAARIEALLPGQFELAVNMKKLLAAFAGVGSSLGAKRAL